MRSISFAVLAVLVAVGLRAAEGPPAAGKPAEKGAGKGEKAGGKAKEAVRLFDGKTLKGWKVLGCDAAVQDGAIFLKGGNGVLRTERKYKDYVFEVEWKALKPDKWDSGIYFRCDDPPRGEPWPKIYQVNLLKGMEGNVEELQSARSSGLVKPGEWNRFKLTVVGTKAELEINGKPAWKADGLKKPEGYIALQAEIPGGGQFLFRDVRITELGAAAEPKEGKTSFDVILKDVGPRKIQVIKEVRAITGLGLKDAKDLVDGAPKPIKEGVSQEEAVKIKERIEAAGGAVEIK